MDNALILMESFAKEHDNIKLLM